MDEKSARKPAYAGSFYPLEKKELAAQVSAFLSPSNGKDQKNLRAIIVPHAGYVYSGATAGKGHGLLSQLVPQPKNIILLGPSHNALFFGLATCSAKRWQTPLGGVDADSIENLCGKSGLVLDACEAHAPEHCLEVQLPFLQSVMKKGFTIFPALTCETDWESAANYLAAALENPKNFLVVSSDLSHYLPLARAEAVDSRTCKIISSLDVSRAGEIDACGKAGIIAVMALGRKMGWTCVQLDYSTSAGASGDDSRVVGYGAFAFYK